MSILKAAIEQVGRLFDVGDVLSYSDSFDRLWGATGNSDQRVPVEAQVVVVWDRTPVRFVGAVRISEYLSPYDWAFVAGANRDSAIAGGATGATGNQPSLRRIVLWDHREPFSRTRHVLFQSAQLGPAPPLPWLSIVGQRRCQEFVDFVSALFPTPDGLDTPSTAGRVEALRQTWATALTRPAEIGDHHALANLVGPAILMGEPSPDLGALNQVLNAAGLTHVESRPRKDFPWIRASAWKEQLDRFVLVDDMAEQGWSRFLSKALDTPSDLQVRTTPSECLGLLPPVDDIKSRKGLSGPEWDRTAVFLDLRLFAGVSVNQEAAFIEKLSQIAALGNVDFKHLDAVARWLKDRTRETPDYLATLALFPTILATADPFLPIVMFSSTGRNTATNALRRFGNIILEFEKPRLDGREVDEIRRDVRRRFERAVKQAKDIARSRAFCRGLIRAMPPPDVERSAAFLTRREPPRPTKWGAAHLFVEENEAGDKERNSVGSPWRRDTFTVGGLCLLLSDAEESTLTRVNKAIAAAGLQWGLAKDQKPLNPLDDLPADGQWLRKFPEVSSGMTGHEHYKEQDRLASELMDRLDACVRAEGARVVGFCIEARRDGLMNQGIDFLYRTMLREALELMMSTVLPRYVIDGAGIGIHVATRSSPDWPVDPFTLRPMTRADAEARFGLSCYTDHSDGKDKYHSLARDHVHAMALEICSDTTNYKLLAARGTQLVNFDMDKGSGRFADRQVWLANRTRPSINESARRYENLLKKPSQRPEQIHYAADWVTRLARAKPGGALQSWFEAGFLDDHANAQRWLACRRAYGSARPEEAIEKAYLAEREDSVSRPSTSIARWVRADAASWVPAVGQDDTRVRRLVSRIRK